MKASIRSIPTEILEIILFESLPFLFNTPDGLPSLRELESFQDNADSDDGYTLAVDIESRLPKDFIASQFAIAGAIRTLMATCKQWKDTIFDSRKLWTRLEIDAFAFVKEPQRLEKLLNRSGAMTIDVKLIFNEHHQIFNLKMGRRIEDSIRSITEIFRKELHRVRVFAIRYPFQADCDPMPQFFPHKQCTELPRLEHFYYIAPRLSFDARLCIGSLRARRLKAFICKHASHNFLWSCLEPESVESLTTISADLDAFSTDSQLQLLNKCRHLRALTLSSGQNGTFDILSSGTFTFLHLESLNLMLTKQVIDFITVNQIKAPQLRSLTLRGIGFSRQTIQIGSFLMKNPQLEELKIIRGDLEIYKDLLSNLIELKTLVLSKCIGSTKFLSSFLPGAPQFEGGIVLPSLCQIIIKTPPLGFVISRTLLKIMGTWLREHGKPQRQFHIWSDEDKFLPTHRAFLELLEKYPESLYWHQWKNPQWDKMIRCDKEDMYTQMREEAEK
ncbi:hypothetical protein M422DRAFT_238677 [Sphaerobolus stellatus SS14]|nr:hypothetical protein M422DRAFT_238677 [Sphaerobolus stellatus SS14]